MKKAWPRVGTWKRPITEALWREPNNGGSINQALNLVTDVAGKGIKRSSEKTIGMADPLTSRTILYVEDVNSRNA